MKRAVTFTDKSFESHEGHHRVHPDHFVYALYDDTGVIRYVGCSMRPHYRVRTNPFLPDGLTLAILYAGDRREAYARESYMIAWCAERGFPLLNEKFRDVAGNLYNPDTGEAVPS